MVVAALAAATPVVAVERPPRRTRGRARTGVGQQRAGQCRTAEPGRRAAGGRAIAARRTGTVAAAAGTGTRIEQEPVPGHRWPPAASRRRRPGRAVGEREGAGPAAGGGSPAERAWRRGPAGPSPAANAAPTRPRSTRSSPGNTTESARQFQAFLAQYPTAPMRRTPCTGWAKAITSPRTTTSRSSSSRRCCSATRPTTRRPPRCSSWACRNTARNSTTRPKPRLPPCSSNIPAATPRPRPRIGCRRSASPARALIQPVK